MKKFAAIIFAMLFCLTVPVISYADDIYYVEDEEEEFIPQTTTTTTKPAETTTASSGDSILGDMGDLGDYFNGIGDYLSGGLDSIISGFEDGLGDFNFGGNSSNDDSQQQGLQPITPGESATVSPAVTTSPDSQTQSGQPSAAEPSTNKYGEELPSVLIVNQADASDDSISGSTLTLLVFVAAIVIIILAGAIVLVIMTKRTEYNSSVRSRSTIPGVQQPDALAQFLDDDIKDDGKDYGNITYWES